MVSALPMFFSQATGLSAQSYRRAVTNARRDRKGGPRVGLTEEQRQEIRYAEGCVSAS